MDPSSKTRMMTSNHQGPFSETHKQPPPKGPGCSWLVVVAAVAASLSGLMLGYELGLTSGVLLQLRDVLSLSCSQQELLVSSQLVGALIACLAGGPVLDHYGRRCSLILSAAMVVGGSVILVAITSLIALILGRVIVGMGIALSGMAACLYIAEISPMERRGLLVTLYELMVVLGVMAGFSCSFAFATVFHGWAYTFGLVIPLALLQMSVLLFLPPSPRFLVTKNKVEEARGVLVRIRRGMDEYVETELRDIQAGLKEESGHSFMELFSANLRSRMLTGVALFFFLQVTGQPNILSYASPLLKSVGFNSVAAATLASTGLGIVKVVFTIPAVLLVDRVGPKKFLCVGAVVMGLALITLGTLTMRSHTQVTSLCKSTAMMNHTDSAWDINRTRADFNSSQSNETAASSLKIASLISLLVYVAAFSVSLGPMVYVVISEIFPMGVRGRAVSVVAAVNWATNLLISMTFLTITEKAGVPNIMFFHSAMCFALLVFVILCVPETKGLTLEEISKELAKKNHLNVKLCRERKPQGSPMTSAETTAKGLK
ncbi:solute carrier family 2, facilitated glucose transporter member 12 isoform X2 [Takifugu rubripes]|uniref:solute carrier family 2, facilitated glucose transporter member 12 isoform X2 n=1 Tax=Takifugu rubripes TaxID=31033 RepID=UPI00114550CE|nr:solute carrier family 2, facilitated glucose transporter member 12 isoform X2 [Takifugu rubripes]